MFKSFEEGAEAFRRLEQGGIGARRGAPVGRGRDRLSLAAGGGGLVRQRAGLRYVQPARLRGGCLAISASRATGTRHGASRQAARATAARPAGSRWARRRGRAWERGRYDGPYLRDALLDHGVMVGDARDGD